MIAPPLRSQLIANCRAESAFVRGTLVALSALFFAAHPVFAETERGEAVAARGPVATRLAKEVMQQGQDADVRTAHALEQRAFGLSFASDDRIEGTTAFVEKRDPSFSGK